jgi:hypothetical protein
MSRAEGKFLLRIAKLLIIIRVEESNKILSFIMGYTMNLIVSEKIYDLLVHDIVFTVPVDPLKGCIGFEVFKRRQLLSYQL